MGEISTREAQLLFPQLSYGALLQLAHKAGVPSRPGPGRGRPLLWNREALLAALAPCGATQGTISNRPELYRRAQKTERNA